MSMFGNTLKETIYQELKFIYKDAYADDWDSAEGQLNFTLDVLDVLHTMFGDW